jgi:hypothetical protein
MAFWQRVHVSSFIGSLALAIALPLEGRDLQSSELIKAEPQALPPVVSRANFETFINVRYPHLILQKLSGTPVFRVLFDPNGIISRAKLVIVSGSPEAIAGSGPFKRIGHQNSQLKYAGIGTVTFCANTIVVMFEGPDSQDLDRALATHYFPEVLRRGLPEGEEIWILFDHAGRVQHAGRDPLNMHLKDSLEMRFPGIRVSSEEVSTLRARDGQPLRVAGRVLRLHSVWLAAGSAATDDGSPAISEDAPPG